MIRIFSRLALLVAVGLFLCLASSTYAAGPTTRERLERVGGVPCPNGSIFTCVTLTVPLDHFNDADTRTIDVVFAVLPSTRSRKGMFVTITGGPGTSGIIAADAYAPYFDPRVLGSFDIVFIDQRGVGLSGGLECYQAASDYYRTDLSGRTPGRAKKTKLAAKTFANECFREMGKPDYLRYLGTVQAVEDLELFREFMGDEKFYLYGESYGTQYAQQYGDVHGDRLAGLILDGVVDLTIEGVPFYGNAAQGFNNALVDSLAVCQENPKCKGDFPARPLTAYDRLMERLKAQDATFEFPLGDGSRATRDFSYDDLDLTALAQMYSPGGRMLFTRALASSARDGDLAPLARLFYSYLALDETTLEPTDLSGWSDAYYYAVICQDYGYFEGNKASRAEQYVQAALPIELSPIRLTGLVWSDLPCVYWRKSAENIPRPPYRTFEGIPTFVMNARSDVITPYWSARDVFEHVDDGYMISQKGGPHIIFGRGNPCIDTPINEFLVNGTLPDKREIECGGKVMSKYIPIAPLNAQDFPSLLAAFQSAETEINYLPEYLFWDFATTVRVGCAQSGWIEYQADGNRTKLTLDNCSFSKGFAMTGSGLIHYNVDRFGLDVSVTGNQTCSAHYKRKGAETNVTGDCEGTTLHQIGAVDELEYVKPDRREMNRPDRLP